MALLMLPFGHMFFEQVVRIDEQGLARLRKLGPRMPRTITASTSPTTAASSRSSRPPARRTGRDPGEPARRLRARP
jgi:hypothetical protein